MDMLNLAQNCFMTAFRRQPMLAIESPFGIFPHLIPFYTWKGRLSIREYIKSSISRSRSCFAHILWSGFKLHRGEVAPRYGPQLPFVYVQPQFQAPNRTFQESFRGAWCMPYDQAGTKLPGICHSPNWPWTLTCQVVLYWSLGKSCTWETSSRKFISCGKNKGQRLSLLYKH